VSDWQAGDLALCIRDGSNTRAGEKFTVTQVSGPFLYGGWGGVPGGLYTCLVFAERAHPRNKQGRYADARFIKVTPPAADAFDREVIDLMRGKPEPVR